MNPVGRIFLANVGANRSHPVRSPLFTDGTFEFIPIPESEDFQFPPVPRYCDLSCFNREKPLSDYLPERYARFHAHRDPDFEQLTYGDLCHSAPRAAGLKKIREGDLLFFLSRLVPFREGRFEDRTAGFFLVGVLEIEEVFADIRGEPSGRAQRRIGRNAHVLRGLVDPSRFDGFWVFAGGKNSLRFRRPVSVNRKLAEEIFRDSRGIHWNWSRRSELQVIGSYTRSCRMVIDPRSREGARAASKLFSAVQRKNPEFPW
ncbi:MAG: hypothetical protein ACE5JS_15740 [Nitrospinota bacterium]